MLKLYYCQQVECCSVLVVIGVAFILTGSMLFILLVVWLGELHLHTSGV